MKFKNFLFVFFMISLYHCIARDISYVPVGHWSYEAIEKLATFGLISMDRLSRKPLRRDEIRRIVIEIIEKVKKNEFKIDYDFYDLELTLLKLENEFLYDKDDSIDGEFQFIYSDKDNLNLGNQKGHDWDEGINLGLSLNKSFFISKNFNITLTPTIYYSSDDYDVILKEIYSIYLFKNWEISLGRFSQWWGPEHHGSLLLTDNALPLTNLKISNYVPFYLPGIFKKLGPSYYTFFISQLEKDREIPKSFITAHRLEINPFEFLTIGFNRVILLGGEDRNYQLSPSNYFKIFFNPKKTEETEDPKFNTNQLFSWDFKIRIDNVNKIFPFLGSQLLFYGELGREAVTKKVYNIFWTPQAVILGLYIPGLFKIDGLDFRFEYADTYPVSASGNWYTHSISQLGRGYPYKYYDHIIGHHMGTNSRDIYFKISKRINENLKFSFEYDKEKNMLDIPNPKGRNTYGIIINYENIRKNVNYEFSYNFIEENNENYNFFSFKYCFKF